MYFVSSKSGITKMWVTALLAIIIVGVVIGAYELSRLSSPSLITSPSPTTTVTPTNAPSQTPITPIQTPTPTSTVGQGTITVTGSALYELSQTEFVFSAGAKTYNVTMDLTTQAVNLNGKLLGGYQIVSQIIPVTSLQLTITGTLSGSTIMAQTVLIPTTKDKIT